MKRSIANLKHHLSRLVPDTHRQVGKAGRAQIKNVNVAGRAHRAVAPNVGSNDAVQKASSTQITRIRQNGEQTYEETQQHSEP